MLVCVGICVCLSVSVGLSCCVRNKLKTDVSVHLKLEHIVVYGICSDEIFLHFTKYKLSSPISQLRHILSSCD